MTQLQAINPGLDVWTIYDHPRDLPGHFVVRRKRVLPGVADPVTDPKAYGFNELNSARLWLEQKGLTCIGRYDEDDPVIVESWI
jgi:hypothetical protein